MKIAVTAANGELGSAIINQLKKDIGIENIVGIARTPEKAKSLGVEIRKGDYNTREDFVTILKGIDALLLVSGMDHPNKRIQQHRNVVEAAKENGVKKIVYTSIIGADKGNGFSPIVASNRQTEKDVKNSTLEWVIGRNGLYIEPDLEYLKNYIKAGFISNCAGSGKCAYTSRQELAMAYVQMLLKDDLNSNTYNLTSTPITQDELAGYINSVYHTNLKYLSLSSLDYLEDRKKELGIFIGTVVGGIYDGISKGSFNVLSDYMKVVGRPHKSVHELIESFKCSTNEVNKL